jgi:hypothetical protein
MKTIVLGLTKRQLKLLTRNGEVAVSRKKVKYVLSGKSDVLLAKERILNRIAKLESKLRNLISVGVK